MLEDRMDPVQILARVGGAIRRDRDAERAFEVWVHLARKAGWEVIETPEDRNPDDSTDLGSVLIEGIKYRIRYSPRVRRVLVDDSTEKLTHRNILGYASWAEPDLSVYKLE